MSEDKWLDWAMELQSIAQSGLFYCKDNYDIERFERIREISAEMISGQTKVPYEKVYHLFCNEIGYQTPKLDTRAAIFKENKILLVEENNGTWSLPGGWVDLFESIKSNTEKEVREEAGLEVEAKKIIAVQDRDKHNLPRYAYGICKVFVLCDIIGGAFKENIETLGFSFFTLDELPELAAEKNTVEQIEMCFQAFQAEQWDTIFD
ncbi:NUDIX domain-containing protein [Clostridium sp. MCC353]|uniref:NUDIX hydrolase N-terminal domain-containing protein n=1 Tax=Clostridium sp. MCC353 TaxID=2592646 RepID=UPI001C02525A|nr:NUDIX hydrolase [Clostridium sp. MCC353]MBT9778998.1 NUDIX domain-containing protein [Clostridium sp. MCC353]